MIDAPAALPVEEDFPALPRAGISLPYQALLWLPRKHRFFDLPCDPTQLHNMGEQIVTLELTMRSKPSNAQDKKGRFSFHACDSVGMEHRITIFGALWGSPWQETTLGQRVFVQAKIYLSNGRAFLNNVEWVPADHVGQVVPIYGAKAGIASAVKIGAAVGWAISSEQAVSDACLAIRQSFDGRDDLRIMQEAGLSGTLAMVLYAVHAPRSLDMAEWGMNAAKRLAVDHLMRSIKQQAERPLAMDSIMRFAPNTMQQLIDALPYTPTQGTRSQKEAIETIFERLAEPYAMDTILTADVGVGKTLCYMVPAVAAQMNGARVAVVVPNSILASGIANEFAEAYPETPVHTVVDAASARNVPWDENPIIIGTVRLNGLVKRKKWSPHLLVVDEQQKMSVEQRQSMRASFTNVIEASATPLPQTVAKLRYGGKTRIEVDKQHAEKTIYTEVVTAEHRREMFARLNAVIQDGYQAAIIYPRVNGNGEEDRHSISSASGQWERFFPAQVVTIHGQMSEEEKASAMAQAKAGAKPLIVASSIIEIGVTIPDLRLLIIVKADRYGSSTLHQMRGRLARRGGVGRFYPYLPDPVDEKTMERVQLLEQTTNGFRLAELDMQVRGCGDLAGEADEQSGKSQTLFENLQLTPADFE